MAKLISDAHLALAYRLGESSAPNDTTELARRLQWFAEAIDYVTSGDEFMWFMVTFGTAATVANENRYAVPTGTRKVVQIKVDNYKYSEVEFDDVYDKYETPNRVISTLPTFKEYSFYYQYDYFYLIPTPSAAPTANSMTATSSGTTVTATVTSHGYATGQKVTVAGANETAYNGTFRIVSTGTNTFTYTAASTPSATPATGTITATLQNIEYWYQVNATAPTSSSSGITVPDQYMPMLVAYAEGRYWSAAHKRGKASDAFLEYETWLERLKKENFRRKFMLAEI